MLLTNTELLALISTLKTRADFAKWLYEECPPFQYETALSMWDKVRAQRESNGR